MLHNSFFKFFAMLLIVGTMASSNPTLANGLQQPIYALLGVSAYCSEHRLVALARACKPGTSEATVRSVYIGVLLSALAAGHALASHSQASFWERFTWSGGEFLVAYGASYLYFQQ